MQHHMIFLRSDYLPECSSSLKVSGHVSYYYKTSGKIFVLYILIFNILEKRMNDNGLQSE
jgi:hypothetical protein